MGLSESRYSVANERTAQREARGWKRSLPRWLIFSALLLLLIVALAPHAAATVRYVDDDYGADNAGLNQWTKIQRAINNATAGDTIYIYSGTYAENVIVNRTLNILGDVRNATIIDPPSGVALSIQAQNVNLSTFKVQGSQFGVQALSLITNLNIDSMTFDTNTRGVYVNLAINVTITGSYFANHTGGSNAGIYVTRGTNVTAKNNTFVNNYYGVYLDRAVTPIIRDSDFAGARYGIYLDQTQQSTIDHNHIGNNTQANGYGIYLTSDHNSTISSNMIDNLTDFCMYVYYSFSERILNNDMSSCSVDFGIYPATDTNVAYFGHNISTTNLVEGKPLYYFVNATNVTVPAGAGWVGAFNTTNLTINAANVSHENYGIWMTSSRNVTIVGLNFTGNLSYTQYGILMYQCQNVTITGLNALMRGTGVYIYYTPNVTIQNSTMRGFAALENYYANAVYAYSAAGIRIVNNSVLHADGVVVYAGESGLVSNNLFNDTNTAITFGSAAFSRASSNTVTNASQAFVVYGGSIVEMAVNLTPDNFWDGRLFRAYFNASNFTAASNLSYILFVNVSNVTVPVLNAHNASQYPAQVAYSNNVTFSDIAFNGTGTGLYIYQSQRVSVLRARTDNASASFYVDTSTDILLANITMTNVTYEMFTGYAVSRLTVQNVSFSCPQGCDYITEDFESSDTIVFDNMTIAGAYSFGYLYFINGITFNRINYTASSPYWDAGGNGIYLYTATNVNITNSTFAHLRTGVYFDESTLNIFVRNVTILDAVDTGFGFVSNDANVTIQNSRLQGRDPNSGVGIDLPSVIGPLTFSGLNISGFNTAISADPLSNISITGSQFNNTTVAVFLNYVTFYTISSNRFTDIFDTAIRIWNSDNGTVATNNITNANNVGIGLDAATNATVTGNILVGGQNGIYITGGRGHLVANNNINGSLSAGIYVGNDDMSSTFNTNTVTSGWIGIWLDHVHYHTLDSNTMSGNSYNFRIEAYQLDHLYNRINTTNTVDGKAIYNLINVSSGIVPSTAGLVIMGNTTSYVMSNQVLAHNWYPAFFWQVTGLTVQGVVVSNVKYGMYANGVVNSTFQNSRQDGGDSGFHFENVYGTLIKNLTVNASLYEGLYLFWGRANTVDNNTINGTGYGVTLYYFDGSNFTSNRIWNQSNIGLTMWYDANDLFDNNNFTGNYASWQMSGYDVAHYNHTINASNLIEGKQVFIRFNATNVVVNSTYGMVILANVTNATITGNTLPAPGHGIELYSVRNVTVSNVSVGRGYTGIYASYTENLTVRNISAISTPYCCVNNLVELQNYDANVTIMDSVIPTANTLLYANYAQNILLRNLTLGIEASSSISYILQAYVGVNNLTIENSSCFYCAYPLYMYSYDSSNPVTNVTVANTTFSSWTYMIAQLWNPYQSNITFYHNSFNMSQAMYGYMQIVDPYDTITWNRSYPTGGNYWSNYTSPDNFTGASQASPGADGIVDFPVWVSGARSDAYPLVDAWPPRVRLVSPANLSAIRPNTTLDFYVPAYFDTVKYSINNGTLNGSSSPFDISTSGWLDGVYFIRWQCSDATGISDDQFFVFAIDTVAPVISALSPAAGGLYAQGTQLNFTITDAHLATNATWNIGGGNNTFATIWNISTSIFPDGSWNVTIFAWDTAGNRGNATFLYRIDGNPPVITLNSPANNSYIQPGTTVDFNITDAFFQNATWQDGLIALPQNLTAPFDLNTSLWVDGVHTIRVWAYDFLGRQTFGLYNFTVDSLQPTITLNTPANSSVIQPGTTIDLTVVDSNLNGTTYNRGLGPVALSAPWDISTAGWPDGLTTVTVIATDLAGNSRTVSFSFTFDSVQPTVTLNSPANNSVIMAGTTIDLAVTDTNFQSATWNNGSGAVSFLAPFDIPTASWPDGLTSITVIALDQAGNSRTRVFVFTFDSTPPSVTLNTPSNNSVIAPGTTLDFAVSDTNLNFVSYDRGSGPVQILSPFDVSTVGWADATYNVTVFANDLAGNNRTRVFVFTVDGTRPTITLNTPANSSVVRAGTLLDFSITDTNGFSATWNNGTSGNVSLTTPFDVNTTGWADATFTVTVNATDVANNVRSSFFIVIIDSTLPTITLNSPANNSFIPAGRAIDLSVSDAHLLTVTWNNGTSGNVTLSSPFDIPTTGWPDGAVNIAVNATDTAGNIRSISFHYTMDSTLPAASLTSPANNSVKTPGTVLDFAISDTNLNTATWNNGSGNVTFTAPFDVSTTGWADGSYAVTVSATDLAANVRTIIINIAIDSVAPSVSLNQPANGSTFGSGTTIDLGVTDLHLQNATWNNGSAPNVLSSPFDIDTTGWAAGTYTVGVNATDQAGNSAGASFTFTIDNSFPAVSLVSPANNSVITPGTTIDVSVVDNDLQSVNYDLGSGSSTFSPPYDISTTGFSDGPVNLTVTATDNSSHTVIVLFRFTIDSTRPTISLNAPSNGSTISAGTTIDLSVTDANAVTATYNIGAGNVALPGPFDISSTGWADGSVTVSVTATDAAGNSRTNSFDFVIDSTAPSITLATPANNSVVAAGTTVDITITDAHSFTATWNNGSGANAFTSPFDISTTGWADSDFDIVVTATDVASNLQTRSFHITIDSTRPAISLNAPSNNSVIAAGTTLDLDIVEPHLTSATWTNGTSGNIALSSPFDIPTTAWPDGLTTVTINATDAAGNTRSSFFRFTLDSTPPSITITTPPNNTYIQAGTVLDFLITDTNLASASWNNGSGTVSFVAPHDVSTTGWADGSVDVQVIALDTAGNSRSVVFHFIVDSTPPTVTLDSPANNSIIAAGTLLAFSVTDNNLNAVTRNNGTGQIALASPFDFTTTAWPDGATDVTIVATDLAANVRTFVVHFTFDSTAPAITVNTPANNSLVRAGTALDFALADANFASATWNNGSGPNALTSPFDVATTGWVDGLTDVTLIATDLAGNSATRVFRFTFDTTPAAIALLSPSNNSIIRAGTILDFAITDANGIGSATRNNGSGALALVAPYDVNTSAWADGGFDVVVNATDAAGNFATASFHFTLDSTPPTVTLVSPANNSVIVAGTLIDANVADLNGLGPVTWNNGSGPNTLASPFDINTSGWADGSVNVAITANDTAGNVRTMVLHFTIDSTAPVITLASPSNNSVFVAGTIIDIDIVDATLSTASYNNSSGAVAFSAPFTVNTTGWADGAFNLVVFAFDGAANVASRLFHFTIDSTAANITLLAPANNSFIAAGTVLDFQITEANLNTSTWNNGSGSVNLTTPFDVVTSGWADGSVTVTITVVDLAGNIRIASFRFTMDSTPPSVSLNFPANNSVILPGTDLDFDALDININNVTWNNGSGPNALGSPYDVPTTGWAEGTRNVTVTATDLAGNTRSLTVRFTFDATPPTIALVSPLNNSIITAGTTIDLTLSDANAFTASWQNGSGPYVITSPWDISTTGWADGVFNVSITAIDAAGNSRTTVLRYTIDSTPPTMTLVAPANNSYLRSGTTLDLTITDLTSLTVTWDYGGGPNALGSPFDINTTGWAEGSTNVTVIAQDAVGLRTTKVFRFTFDNTQPAVSLLSPANNSVIVPGFQINISITDANLQSATYDIGGGATSFSTLYNITTSSFADGSYNISVDATDLAGNTRNRVFHITIDSGVPTVTLVTPSNNSYIVAGTNISLTITDTNLNTATWDDGGGAQPFGTQWVISTTGYADGSWNFSVRAVDLAGNARTRIFHFTVDSTLPAVALLSPANNSYFGAGMVINFTITDTNLNAATWDDGTGAQSFASNYNISTTGWADGVKNIVVQGTDLAGNVRTRSFRFTVDSTLPTVTLLAPTNDTHFVAGTLINFTVADTNLNAAQYDAGSGAVVFTTPFQIATAGWPDASYNISVQASDLAGNVRIRYYRFWVDSTPPVISISAGSAANNSFFDQRNTTQVQLDIAEGHLLSATWSIGGPTNSFTAPFTIAVSTWGDGSYNVTVRATDRAGTLTTFLYHFTLDSVDPVIADTPWEGTYFTNGTFIAGTLSDINLLWATTQIDAAAPVNGSFTAYNISTAGLAERTHSLRVQAMDRAGHLTVRVFLFYIDSFAPAFDLLSFSLPDGAYVRPGAAFNFQVDDDYLSTVTWRRAPGATLSTNGTGPVKAINTSTWLDGNWSITLTATDLAGHVSTMTYLIIIDASAPLLPPALPQTNTFQEDIDQLLDASGARDGPNPLPDTSFAWDFSVRNGPLSLGTAAGAVVHFTWFFPGDYNFTLTITDLAGNAVSHVYDVHVTDTTPPAIALAMPTQADEDADVIFDGSGTTDNDPAFWSNNPTCAHGVYTITGPNSYLDTLTLSAGGGPNPQDCLAYTYSFPEPGVYNVQFTVADKAGLGNSTNRSITIADVTGPDLSQVTFPTLVNEGANVNFDATNATDNDLANLGLLQYSWVVKLAGSTVATFPSATASRVFATPGAYVVTLTVTDSAGNPTSQNFNLRVNDIPTFIGSIPLQVTVNQLIGVDVTFADNDTGDVHTADVVSPVGATVSTSSGGIPRISWTPTTYGIVDFVFDLSDGMSTVRVNRTIQVEAQANANNVAPHFTSIPIQELTASVLYQYDANAVDVDSPTIYYDLVAGPVGMSIDTVTGAVTWSHGLTPSTTTQTFRVNISAWDGLAYGYQEYTLQLRAVASQKPVWSTGFNPPTTVVQGTDASVPLAGQFSDPDAEDQDTLAITVVSSSLTTATAEIIGEGQDANLIIHGIKAGTVTISLKVTDQAGKNSTKTFTMTVTPPPTTTPPSESSLGFLPILALIGAAGGVGFFMIARGRKRKDDEKTRAAEEVRAVEAATLAAEAGTVVVTPEVVAPAAVAAAAVVAAVPAEKKITYTIEGLFVIYKDGRLLYSKTDLGQQKFEDPELVSSMFTAVQSFIKDSFSSEGELNKMGYGDNQIIIERGRSVFTAAIVYGEPDQEFHDQMKAAIENIELSYAGVIEDWDGMMDSFADIEPKLAGILALTAGITRREVALATTKQEVQMLSELEFFQGFVRLKCGIKNNTPSVITKATVDIEYNEDVLRLARVEPAAYRTSGAKVLLGVLNPGEKSSVAYYFDPQICTESQIDGVCRYRDASGVLHTVAMKTRKAEVVCPLFFTKEHANTAMLKRLVENELGEKDSKVFEIQKIPPYIKHKDVFDLIKSVVNAHDVQMVREFTKFNPFQGEAWFFGETKVKGYKIVIRATVIEDTNVIEFFAASSNMKAITGLLAEFNHTLNSMVIEKYSDLKIAQIFDSNTKAEIEKKSLMSNMSSADLEGGETDQAGTSGGESAAPAAPPSDAPPGEPPKDEEELDLSGLDGDKKGEGGA